MQCCAAGDTRTHFFLLIDYLTEAFEFSVIRNQLVNNIGLAHVGEHSLDYAFRFQLPSRFDVIWFSTVILSICTVGLSTS